MSIPMNFAFRVLSWRFAFRVILGRATPVVAARWPRPIGFHVLQRDGRTNIARSWIAEDARRCRLCPQCTATINDDGKTAMCLLSVPGTIDMNVAEMYRCRELMPKKPATTSLLN
jgi:hypothetical protein